MNTLDYRTKTIFAERDNGVVVRKNGSIAYPMGIDIGYGGVKLYAPNICAVFPSYARQIDLSSFLEDFATDDILYTDLDNGTTWLVGRGAQNGLSSSDTSDTIEALCGRNRYYSPMFKVLVETAMGIALMDTNNYHYRLPDGEQPYISTGLPCQYIDADTPLLKDVLSGVHNFKIQIGKTTPKEYYLNIPMDHINVMRQPMGTYISVATKANWVQEKNVLTRSNVLILDPGFKTFDTFGIKGGEIDSKESWQNLGMSRVLSETSKEILKNFGMDIPASHMQKYLETGEFTCIDRKSKHAAKVDFSYILEAKSKEICQIAINQAFDIYDGFIDYDYVIISGGTGAAWKDWIKESLSGMSTLKIIADDTPDGMPMFFQNARGYYSFIKAFLSLS